MNTCGNLFFQICLILGGQQLQDVQFVFDGNMYSFSLPDLPFTSRASSYTEGSLYSFSFSSGQRIGLFVGGNMVLPLLNDKKYKVLSKIKKDGIEIRKGCDRTSGNFWQEVTLANSRIVVYFDNVNKNEVPIFEESLETLISKFRTD